jgi:hypothetical protein
MRTSLIVALAAAFPAVFHPQPDRPTGSLTARHPASLAGVKSFAPDDFKGEQFPPAGWSLEFSGAQYWGRMFGVSGIGTGTSAAVFSVCWAPTTTAQGLVVAAMRRTQPADSLRFDPAYATFQTENDRLVV